MSSDHEILDEARAAGARTLTAQDFADAIERPPHADKEKPEAVSSAEVEAWLEIFGEPDPAPTQSPVSWAKPPQAPREEKPKQPKRKQPPAHTKPPERHHTVSIGEQMGLDVEVPPENKSPTGKPENISDREVEAWLQVFHDDPDSEIPPPNLPKPKRRKRPQRRKEPVVRKDGELSSDEVDSWLEVFSDQVTHPPAGEKRAKSSEPKTPATFPDEEPSDPSKLAAQREKFAPAEGQGKAELSDEDKELWQRLFGDGE